MVQVLPQVRVFQELTPAVVPVVEPLRAFIVGPHYNVRSYAKDKDQVLLGAYDPDDDEQHFWPWIQPGEVVDQSFTSVNIDNAWIRYFQADSESDAAFTATGPNRVVMDGDYGWRGATRLAGIPRDVVVGDVVRISIEDSASDGQVFVSQVRSFVTETDGRVSTLVLANGLPSEFIDEDVSIELITVKDIVLLENRQTSAGGGVNWEQTASTITIKAGAVYYADGDPINDALVLSGTVYVSYRAMSTSWTTTVQSIDDAGNLLDFFNDLTPDNPLGFGVKAALANSNGTPVRFLAVTEDTLNGYVMALDKTLEREDVYGFTPMSADRSVQNLIQSHVLSQSAPEKGRWRIAWLAPTLVDIVQVVDSVNASFGNWAADPGTAYRLVTASNATFVTDGVQAGDTVRYSYTLGDFGEDVWVEDTVAYVINEVELVVTTGPAAAIVIPDRIEVWRSLNTDAQVANLTSWQTFGSRRVYAPFAGGATMDGFENVPDYFVAAAFAGLRSGVAPHQGLTNVQVVGIEATPFTSDVLSATQLDALMNAGFWVVVKDAVSGQVYCRKQISTDLTDINTTEQSVTTNLDSQSYVYKSVLAPYIGRANNVATVQSLIEADLEAAFEAFYNRATPILGSQILDGTSIRELRPHATFRDRLVVVIDTVIPYPLNNVDLYIVI